MSELFDVVVVGGGVVGLATAHRLTESYPDRRVVLLEKEEKLAAHQTGHNSGVIHSGLYYKPGSTKARTAVTGAATLKEFCREHGISFKICGKVVVATRPEEIPALEDLHQRGMANGVPGLAMLGPERLREIEPHASGVRALHVPQAGIVDFAEVAAKLGQLIEGSGGLVRTSIRLRKIRHLEDELVLETNGGPVRSRFLIACAGLHADRVARLEGESPGVRIVPFRGEYYELAPERRDLVKALIYPVPDPRFPFLGVHFTRGIHGTVEAGPNAVLAFHREGYRKAKVSLKDVAEVFFYPGFWRLAARYWKTGMGEMVRSFSKRAFVRALSKLVPEIRTEDLCAGGSGVRAQALARSGSLVDDFLIVERPRALHVLNAPSPAATASLAIAQSIVERASDLFGLGKPVDQPRLPI